ncbi:hypothetical protein BG000_003180 [Podila horticola]|nr:hypothetical protein BG000_003180 [Podila horticola]
MSDIDNPLCAAANSNTIFLAAYTPQNSDNSGRPTILALYSTQQYPTSLSSIQWKVEAMSYINNWMFPGQSLPVDGNGYWCAVDDTGTFAIFSGTKDTTQIPNPMQPLNGTIQGLLYDKPSKPTNPTSGGLAVPAYTHVSPNGTYPCLESGSCNAHLYTLPSTTAGAPSNFGFVTYNSTSGFSFEMLDRTSNKFTGQVGSGIPPSTNVNSWDAFGYTNSRLVVVSTSDKQFRAFDLDARGLPTGSTTSTSLDMSAANDCGSIGRGFYTNVNGRSYFSCKSQSNPALRYIFSTDGRTLTKVTEVPERTDITLRGIVPVPAPNGRAPTWALAYSGEKSGLYSMPLSESGGGGGGGPVDQKTASNRAAIIGGVVGAVVDVLGIAGFLFWRRRRQQQESNKTQTQEKPKSFAATNSKPDASVDGNSAPLSTGNNELRGDASLPMKEEVQEPPLPALPQAQPQPQAYTQAYPQAYLQQQQYPHPAPHFAQTHQTYPQPQMYQNYSQPQPNPGFIAQPIPPVVSSQSFSVPAQPYHQQRPLPPTAATSSPSANDISPAEQFQQEPQFSSHPRPNFINTVGGVGPQTTLTAPSTSGP